MANQKGQEGGNAPDMERGSVEGSAGESQDQLSQLSDMEAGAEFEDELEEGGGGGSLEAGGKSSEIEGLLKEKGLRTAAELRDFVKNLEKKNTELGQEVRTMRVATMFPPPQVVQPQARAERKALEMPEDPSEFFTDKEKFRRYMVQAEEVFTGNAMAQFEEASAKKEYQRLYEQAVAKAQENPEEFERLRPKMLTISQRPGWQKADLDRLYNRAKEEEGEEKKRQLSETLAGMGLSSADLDQIKALLGKTRTGQISTAGGASGDVTERPTSREEMEKAIRDRILNAKAGG